MISMLKKNSAGSQTFWGRDELGGVLGAFVDAVLTTGDTLLAANDWTGLVTVAVIGKGTHTYQMARDGVATGDEYTFVVNYPNGSEDFDILVTGDNASPVEGYELIPDRETLVAMHLTTEANYVEGASFPGEPVHDGTLPTSSNPTKYNDFLVWYRAGYLSFFDANNSINRFYSKFPSRFVWHNHEFASETSGLSKSGEIQFDAALKAFQEWEGNGNPVTSDIDVDSWPDPIIYYDEIIGNTQVIMTDFTSYSDGALDQTMDGAGVGRGESKQSAWLKRVIDNTTADFIVIYNPSFITTDEWVNPTTGILFTSAQTTTKPILFLSANNHTASARDISRAGMTKSFHEIGISPLKQTSRSVLGSGGNDVVYFNDVTGTDVTALYDDRSSSNWVYGIVKVRPNGSEKHAAAHIEGQVKNVITGEVRWSVILPISGEQILEYARAQ